ncbi:MAG: orotate phosphoribosyltransferase [Nitrospirae bacterium]|nr:MAG: orotate phosphoribosyltransferase [Nitrospirota bacterium]
MSNERERLLQLIRERAFRRSDTPSFKLSSGKMSSYYFNMKKVNYNPEGLYLVGKEVYELIKSKGLNPRGVGGLTLGADPIAVSVALYSWKVGDPIEAFVIRKEPKGHGTAQQVEGNMEAGDSVVILEDVVTTGGSTIKAIKAAQRAGLRILAVVALIDRCEENGRENIERLGYPFYSLFTINDIISEESTK